MTIEEAILLASGAFIFGTIAGAVCCHLCIRRQTKYLVVDPIADRFYTEDEWEDFKLRIAEEAPCYSEQVLEVFRKYEIDTQESEVSLADHDRTSLDLRNACSDKPRPSAS